MGHLGSSAEWVARLPSALAGIAFVGCVWWLALRLSGRRVTALLAAAIAALSPFVLEYAQLAEEYALVLLAVTVAAAASLEADRARGRARGWWLALSCAAAVIAPVLHYTSVLAVVPLCVWVGLNRGFRPRWRVAYLGCCAVAEAALVPLFVDQYNLFPTRSGVAASASVSARTTAHIFGTPLVGRTDTLLAVAVVITVTSLGWLLIAGRRTIRAWPLVATIAVGVPVVLLVLSALGRDLMLTRYAAPAAPFMIVTIAAAVTSLRVPLGAALGLATAVVAVAGLATSHSTQGFYLDARAVTRYIEQHSHRGDAVLTLDSPGVVVPLEYYGLRPHFFDHPLTTKLVARRTHRLWVVYGLPTLPPKPILFEDALARAAKPQGYRLIRMKIFTAIVPVAVVLEVPFGSRP
jgi:uncharacterized membrane protein